VTPRVFADANAALLNAYEEEVSGAAYFAGLAAQHTGHACEALLLIVEMEEVTARLLQPVIDAAGLCPGDADELAREGHADAEALRGTGWDTLLTGFRDDYGAYVAEFEAVRAAVPPHFRTRADLLVAHEVAIIDFARAELAGEADSQSILRGYLAEACALA
jgi:hypothetical protein